MLRGGQGGGRNVHGASFWKEGVHRIVCVTEVLKQAARGRTKGKSNLDMIPWRGRGRPGTVPGFTTH